MAIGVADRDIMDAILVRLEGGQDALRGEAVDRRHHRRLHQPREGERHEIGLVVNEVELARALEDMGDVEHLPHLGVDAGVLGIGRRADAGELARGRAVLRGEQGDVDAARHQRLGQQAGHQLPRAVMARRRAPGDRRQHGDAQAIVLPASHGHQDHALVRAQQQGAVSDQRRVGDSGQEQPAIARPVRQRQAMRPSAEIERHDQSLRAVPALIGEHVAFRVQQREVADRQRRMRAPEQRAIGDRASGSNAAPPPSARRCASASRH